MQCVQINYSVNLSLTLLRPEPSFSVRSHRWGGGWFSTRGRPRDLMAPAPGGWRCLWAEHQRVGSGRGSCVCPGLVPKCAPVAPLPGCGCLGERGAGQRAVLTQPPGHEKRVRGRNGFGESIRRTERGGGWQADAQPGEHGSTCVFVVSHVVIKSRRLWHFKCFQINLYSSMVMRKQLLSKR